jgi:hypothetical protein
MYTTALLCFPKNFIPWQDTNPGLLVPEADAMSMYCAMPPGHGPNLLKVSGFNRGKKDTIMAEIKKKT